MNGAKTSITSRDVADVGLLFGKWTAIEDPPKGAPPCRGATANSNNEVNQRLI